MVRGDGKYVCAGDICRVLKSGAVTGEPVDPDHVYRVGNAWHHIPDEGHRGDYGFPDARMSRIWGSSTNHDHDNDSQTPQVLLVRVPECHSPPP
jgi:hypothetical protein